MCITSRDERLAKTLISSRGRLFETIQCPLKSAYIFRWSSDTGRRLHINNLRYITIQEGIFNIHPIEWPLTSNINSKKIANRCHFYHSVINSILLCESSSNETSLIPFNRTIRFDLDFVNAFTAHWICTRWLGNKIPSMSTLERCLFDLGSCREWRVETNDENEGEFVVLAEAQYQAGG